ncbi:hypothetical protein ACFOY4_25380 [Actinomadura syzygii]|uniref:Mce-associated membrane protein n=1 Tax=Actinomadura syzygii TaxID=1427538 RepID=A0A5D0UKD7_9ACTN|nr:hypothetical protein [Actinomadura syzygii]TYC18266.1 hypothetical protein FXF65_00350 [Actinomadura syzygii]
MKSDMAARAEEAAEAARLAEEAAAKAREAARLARLAAEEAEAEGEAAEETDGEDAAKSLQKPDEPQDGPEVTSDGDSSPEGDSDAPEPASATTEQADDDDDEEDEPEKPRKRSSKVKLAKTRGASRSSRSAGSLTLVIAVLAVLTVALGAGTTALALKVREQHATETAAKEASFAASRAAQKLSSYDYQTLDADLKEASATTTGKLHTQYDKLAAELRATAIQRQAVSNTTVLKVGVESATPEKVVALVYANRSSATKDDKQQSLPESLRIRLTMVEKDGKWLASELVVIS